MRFGLHGVVAAALVLTLVGGISWAGEPQRSKEFGFQVGVVLQDKELTNKDNKIGPALGVRFENIYNNHGAWFIDLTANQVHTDTASERLDQWALRIGNAFILSSPSKTARWFIAPAIGYSRYDARHGDQFDRGMISVGVGQRIKDRDRGTFRWEVRLDQTMGGRVLGIKKPLAALALVGYGWGGKSRLADSDKDGVPDCDDACPSTPLGAKVDAKGCPMDTDGDGVYDGIDRCPDTPKGWPVDETGCPKDTDQDGVVDGLDRCPGTPKGAKVDANGCPIDSDEDGVFDGLDKCPGTPKGAKVDANGCPIDSDEDGVYDGLDRCPGTPKGTKVDANGCPIEEPKAKPLFEANRRNLVLEGVNFEYDKALLKPESTQILDGVAESLAAWPEVRVEVAGHTDSRGADAYNLKLSESRAKTVRDYLISKGIAADRLTAKGYGETKPIADNKTDEGRAKNRRVELNRLD